jgi:hypothetical protein
MLMMRGLLSRAATDLSVPVAVPASTSLIDELAELAGKSHLRPLALGSAGAA